MVKDIIRGIIENNSSFMAAHDIGYFRAHMTAQHPRITLVACCDSRVQPHIIEPDPIDNVFTIQTIGNQMASALGSVDYGILHLHTPVLLIMGHTDCGAVKAFMKGYEKENDAIKAELDNLKPALKASGGGNLEDELQKNVEKNVDYQVSLALRRYKSLVDEGRLVVVGAVYDFVNALRRGCGRVVIMSINGVSDKGRIKKMPFMEGIALE